MAAKKSSKKSPAKKSPAAAMTNKRLQTFAGKKMIGGNANPSLRDPGMYPLEGSSSKKIDPYPKPGYAGMKMPAFERPLSEAAKRKAKAKKRSKK